MWNRLLASLLCLVLAAFAAHADEKPYRVSLIGDGFDGTSWHTGVLVELAPGWKTYWRMPGDSGVPPDFTWTASQPARIEVGYPTPARHADKSGEAVGYDREVLFPVTVTPDKPGNIDLKLDLFFGVCKDICIPAQASASVSLGTSARDPLGSLRVDTARAALPTPGDAVTAAEVVMHDGKPALQLTLKERPEDIFVESTTSAYFRAPVFSDDGRQALLPIGSLGDVSKLKGQALTITYLTGGKGHEQTLMLP